MATVHGRTTRLVNLARKHDPKLLARTIDKHHEHLRQRGLRKQADYLLEELGDFAEDLADDVVREDKKISHLGKLVETARLRDKLICTVFNEMAKGVQDVVMEGPEAQLRYLVDRYGLAKTEEIVRKLAD